MIIENPEALKTWLTTVLAPLCDADPAALAKYVLALAKKEKPESELRVAMTDQLDVFLQQETRGFVDKLFITLDSKSYLQSNPEGPAIVEEVPTVNGGAIAVAIEGEKTTDANRVTEARDTKKKTTPTVATTTTTERTKRKSFSPKSRSRSRSRERPRRSRSRDRTRDRGARGWEDRRRRSPVSRRTDRRRSRSPARRSRSPRNRRPHLNRSRSRSPVKGVSPRSPVTAAKPAEVVDSAAAVAVAVAPDVAPVVTLPIQSVIVTPDNRPKFRCRDYDEKGYCMRGDLCPYDHGADPVVLEEGELSSMLKFNRPPPGAPPVGPPPPHMRGPPPSLPPGEPYNPDAPGISWPPPPYAAGSTGGPPGMSGMRPLGPPANGGAGYNAPPPFGHMSRMPPPHMRGSGGLATRGGHLPPRGPPPMGLLGPAPPSRELISVPTNLPEEGGESVKRSCKEAGLENDGNVVKKGNFDYNRLGARRFDPTNCCLEVKKIPRGLNNISILNNHFGKFGKIVNLQVSFNGDVEGALVTFSSHAEAQAAYRSTEAVLNNRFIKVFWHNKDSPEGKQENVPPTSKMSVKERLGGGHPQKVLTQSQVPVILDEAALKEATEAREKEREKAVAAIIKSQEILAAKEALKKKQEEQKRERTKLQVDLQRRKQELLDKQLQQQRVLIERLEKNKSNIKGDERAAVMQTVRTLQESIETLKKDLQVSAAKESNAIVYRSPFQPVAGTKSVEEAQKEILDAEIELYQKQQEGSDTTELQKRVQELHTIIYMSLRGSSTGRRGLGRASLRGILRGRGRGSAIARGSRGRGRAGYYVPPHVSVDRRPTQLKVTGFENQQQGDILAHFANFGEVVDYDVDETVPTLVIRYKARKDAEMALVQGRLFPSAVLDVNWHLLLDSSGNNRKKDDESATGLDAGSVSPDEEEEENEGLDDLLNYEEDEEDEVERSWRR